MNKILTISIAAYYVEEFLPACLDSFAEAKVDEDIEVLIVNDGSGEGVNEIAREYERKNPTVFRLVDKENGGHGSTINRGIEEATGKYFKVVDGDDKVIPSGLAELIACLKETEADIVVSDYRCFENGTERILEEKRNDFPGRECGKIYDFDAISDRVYLNMHAITYRTSILKGMGRRLTEHCFYVDAEYCMFPLPYIRTVCFLGKPVYLYRLGMTTQSMAITSMQKNCSHHEKVLDVLLKFYKEMQGKVSPEKSRYMAKGAARILVSQIKIYLSFPPDPKWRKKIRELDRQIRERTPQVYRSVENKAVKLLRASRYWLYPLASRACRKTYHCEKGGDS